MQAFKAFRLSEADKKIRTEFVDCTLDDLDPGLRAIATSWEVVVEPGGATLRAAGVPS